MKLIMFCAALAIGGAASAITPQEWKTFQPIVELAERGDTAEALNRCEQQADQLSPAAAVTYLLYSRGLAQRPIDYRRAATWLDRVAYTGYFWSEEVHGFIRGNYAATATEKSVSVLYEERHTFRLHSLDPLDGCYREEMDGRGGPIAFFLYQESAYIKEGEDYRAEMEQAAVRLGSQSAAVRLLSRKKFTTAEDPDLERLKNWADSGHVPAMLLYAKIRLNEPLNWESPPRIAYAYLLRAGEIIAQYQRKNCVHCEDDARQLKNLRSSLPDLTQTTAELLKITPANKRAERLLTEELAGRYDDPACEFFRGLQLFAQDQQAGMASIAETAESGVPIAVRYLVSRSNPSDPQSWYHYYLAAKHQIPIPTESDPAQKAFFLLRNLVLQNPAAHKESLRKLMEIHPPAAELFQQLFQQESAQINSLQLAPSNPELIRTEWTEIHGRKALHCRVRPSEQLEYLDLFFAKQIENSNQLRILSKQASELIVQTRPARPHQPKQAWQQGNASQFDTLQSRLRILVPPRQNELEFTVVLP